MCIGRRRSAERPHPSRPHVIVSIFSRRGYDSSDIRQRSAAVSVYAEVLVSISRPPLSQGKLKTYGPLYARTQADIDGNALHYCLSDSTGDFTSHLVGKYKVLCITMPGKADSSSNVVTIWSATAPSITTYLYLHSRSGESKTAFHDQAISGPR